MHTVAVFITNHLIRHNIITEDDADIYIYGFECSLADIAQVVILIVAGAVLGIHIELFTFVISFALLKQWIGGWHAKTHLMCFFLSTVMSVSPVLLCKLAPIWISLVFLAVSNVIVILLAPIPYFNNPKTYDELTSGRERALRILLILNFVAFAFYQIGFRQIVLAGSCGVFMASITLLPIAMGKEVKTWERRKKTLSDLQCLQNMD